MIKCRKCNIEKYIYDFYKAEKKKNGVTSWCKECTKKTGYKGEELKKYNAKYRRENKRKISALNKKWRKNNPQKINEIQKRKRLNPVEFKKIKCREKTRQLIRYGKLKKTNICENCYLKKQKISSPTHCHHTDYNDPYTFIELCETCHRSLHISHNSKEMKIPIIN